MNIKEFKNKIKYLWAKAFIRDVAILQFGSLFSTGLSVIASIIFARVLGAGNFGLYSIIFAFAGLVGMFLDFGTSYASITLIAEAYARGDKKEIKNILTYYIRVTLAVDLFIGGIAIIFSPYFTNLLYRSNPGIGALAPQIGHYARLVLGAMILGMIYSMATSVMYATRKIAALTISENINKIFIKFLPVVFVLMGMGLFGIVFAHFITAAIFFIASIIFYEHLLAKDKLLPNFKEVFFNKEKIEMWRYFKFGFQIAISKNLAALFSYLPMLFAAKYIAPSEIACFGLALSYVGIPMLLVSCVSRLLNVQLPKSRVLSRKLLKEHFIKTAIYSLLIMIGCSIFIVLFASFLVRFFYGNEYLQAIKMSYYLIFYVILSSAFIGVGPIYRTMYKVKIAIIIDGAIIVVGIPIIFWAIKNYGINGLIWTQILWHNITAFITFFYAIKLLNQEIEKENKRLVEKLYENTIS